MPNFTRRKEMGISFLPYPNGTSARSQDTLSVMPWDTGPFRAAGRSAQQTPSPEEAVCFCALWLPSDPAAPLQGMTPQACLGPSAVSHCCCVWKQSTRELVTETLLWVHGGISHSC